MKLALLLSGILLADPRVTVRAVPTVLLQGGTVRVTCRVLRNPANRVLAMGLSNYRESEVQLDGDAAPITHEVFYEHVPCETDEAFCAVVDATGRTVGVARQPVLVACR